MWYSHSSRPVRQPRIGLPQRLPAFSVLILDFAEGAKTGSARRANRQCVFKILCKLACEEICKRSASLACPSKDPRLPFWCHLVFFVVTSIRQEHWPCSLIEQSLKQYPCPSELFDSLCSPLRGCRRQSVSLSSAVVQKVLP